MMEEEQASPRTGLCDDPATTSRPKVGRVKERHDPGAIVEEDVPMRPYKVRARAEVAS